MSYQKLPTISVITPTYNSAKTLKASLRSIREQDYPQENIEIILGDGGSTDETLKIARKYEAKVIAIPQDKQNAEFNRGVAFNAARKELVLVYDHDNFLPYRTWLRDMVQPLLDYPDMVATETCYYHYDPKFGLLDRYFALYGASEPLPIFLGKQDRMAQFSSGWSLLGEAKDKGSYYVVKFQKDPHNIPTIGTNGCLFRRKILVKYAKISPDNHYPIDVMVDVILKGDNKFGFVKNSIIHRTSYAGFLDFLRRRKGFVDKYHFKDFSKRRYSVVMKGDWVKVGLYVLYSLTLVGPLVKSMRGYLKIRDKAWFLYPIMCVATTFIYGYSTLSFFLKEHLVHR